MWQNINHELYHVFLFSDFDEAFSFMTKVALLSAGMNHHPRWQQDGNQVEIWLTTHDAGNTITSLDYLLAEQIDLLTRKYYPLST